MLVRFFSYLLQPWRSHRKGLVLVEYPRRIRGAKYIKFGKNVRIGSGSYLACISGNNQEYKIEFGDGVVSTGMLQIHSMSNVHIGDNVLFATNVFISDCGHEYSNGRVPYMHQGYGRPSKVSIGSGSWIGQNVVILPGITIGENCIIGANSVVTKSIPDQCIAVGSPARVVKQFCNESELWKPV